MDQRCLIPPELDLRPERLRGKLTLAQPEQDAAGVFQHRSRGDGALRSRPVKNLALGGKGWQLGEVGSRGCLEDDQVGVLGRHRELSPCCNLGSLPFGWKSPGLKTLVDLQSAQSPQGLPHRSALSPTPGGRRDTHPCSSTCPNMAPAMAVPIEPTCSDIWLLSVLLYTLGL